MNSQTQSTCRILSLDGGGIKGIIPGTILNAIEKAVGDGPLANHFHLIAGTSTGGILAAGLALELPVPKLLEFYTKQGPGIFSSNYLGMVGGPKYPAAPLEEALLAAFGSAKLSDLPHDLLCPTYDIQARSDLIFKSWKARGVEEVDSSGSDFLVREVARATAAAPTYFAPALVTNIAGTQFPCIDGGMYGNCPALLAFVAARRLMPLATRFLVVSIGTGAIETPIPMAAAVSWGVVGWATTLLDILFSAMGDTVDYELDQLAPLVSHLRLQSSLTGASDAMDDASPSNLTALAACAARTIIQRKTDLDALIAELQMPLPDRAAFGYPQALGNPRPRAIAQFDVPKIQATAVAAAPVATAVMAASAAKAPPAPLAASMALAAPVPPRLTWRVGGAAAGAFAGASLAGPIGAVVGGIAGYLGGSKLDG